MSGFELHSVHCPPQPAIPIPLGETTIGRGPLLAVTDAKVSRKHAVLHTTSDGRLWVKPTHHNPTFYKPNGEITFHVLERDCWQEVKHKEMISLLPTTLAYEVIAPKIYDSDATDTELISQDQGSESDSHSHYNESEEEDDRPECGYGTSCYRLNPQHREQFKHSRPPPSPPVSTGTTVTVANQPSTSNHGNGGKTKQKQHPKKRKKDEDGEDDELNEYDFDDSFIDDDRDVGTDEDFLPSCSLTPPVGARRTRSTRSHKKLKVNYRDISESSESGTDTDREDSSDTDLDITNKETNSLCRDAIRFLKNSKMHKK